MNRYDKLMARIARGENILIDGATGTEIERRGVPQLENAWNGGGALTHPQIVRQVHEDYIRHGAEIVISNTFATHKHCLADAGVEDKFEAYNRIGIELAIEARTHLHADNVLVAGGMSYWSFIDQHPALPILQQNAKEQAQIMADAGADLLMLEMMVDIDRMLVCLDAAQSTGLPVWPGLSCKPNGHGVMCLYNGDSLADALSELKKKNIPLVSIMHTEVDYVDACLDVLEDHWEGPVGVYAHSGDFVDNKWIFDDTITPVDYAGAAKRWIGRGVQVVGGCCGITGQHIAALSRVI